MDCKLCGNWFASASDSTVCHVCQRRLGGDANHIIELLEAEEQGRLVAVTRCIDCYKRNTPMCHAGHEQADTDYCSHALPYEAALKETEEQNG